MLLSSREKDALEKKKQQVQQKRERKQKSGGLSEKAADRQYVESCGFKYTTIRSRMRRHPELTLEEAMAVPTRTPHEAALNALSHTRKKRREKFSRVQPDQTK